MHQKGQVNIEKKEIERSSKVVHLHPTQLEDGPLWNAFRAGDDKALIVIFDRYAQPLYNYGKKIFNDVETVRDCIQDLFFELYKNRSGLGETNAIKFYLFKSLRRKLLKIKVRPSTPFLENSEQSYPSPEVEIIDKQQTELEKQELESRLGRLTNRQREAVFLRYFEELSYEKIGQIMDLNKQSIYNLINESISILRK